MILEEGTQIGKHEAEQARFGAGSKKRVWEASQQGSTSRESQAQELLAWELEQEHWTEKSDAAILEDSQWQRVGIGRANAGSPYPDGEVQLLTPGRQSPLPSAANIQAFSEAAPRPPTSPIGSFSQNSVEPLFLKDQRKVKQPMSPGSTVRDSSLRMAQRPMSPGSTVRDSSLRMAQRPMSPGMSVRSSHLHEAALSPTPTPRPMSPALSSTPRPMSPALSLRSVSPLGRYNTPEPPNFLPSPHSEQVNTPEPPNYSLSPHSQQANGHAVMQTPEPIPQIKVFGQETLGMRVRSFSPPAITRQSSSMSGPYPYPYGGPHDDHFRGLDESVQHNQEVQNQIVPPYHQGEVARSASWNAYSAVSDADRLEAEFARLESTRGQNSAFPGVPSLEERDETSAVRSLHAEKMGYELEELEQEFERLENSRKEKESAPAPASLEKVPSDEVIHLEDQASFGDEDVQVEGRPKQGVGIEELEAEFDEAVRRKEALMRGDSPMVKIDGDEILAEEVVLEVAQEEPPMPEQRSIPIRKSRWQEKLERFERRGLADAEANLDVSKYPRLQQIRQRRRERLKALMNIRQERAEIWNTLEANWEQMENSMQRRLVDDSIGKRRGKDPEPTTPRQSIPTAPLSTSPVSPVHGIVCINDDDTQADSLKLSASEASAPEAEESMENKEHAALEANAAANLVSDNQASMQFDVSASKQGKDIVGNTDPAVSLADIVDDLVEDFMVRNSLEETGSPAVIIDNFERNIPERALSPKTIGISAEQCVSPKSITTAAESAASPMISTADTAEQAISPTSTKEDAIPESTKSLLASITGGSKKTKVTKDEEPLIQRPIQKEDPPPSFGAYISQNVSDVGTKVVNILKSVGSKEKQPVVASQGTDNTNEEEGSQLDSPTTEEARDDDETNASVAARLGLSWATKEEEDPELEQQGCVNPLQSLIGNERQHLVVDDVAGSGCINPLASLVGLGGGACTPVLKTKKSRKGKGSDPEYIEPLPSNSFDLQDDTLLQGYIKRGQSDSLSQSYDRDVSDAAPVRPTAMTSRALTHHKKSKRSKKNKNKRSTVGVDTFFTLVDDLLVNQILNIVDEKVVDNVAHTFGFD